MSTWIRCRSILRTLYIFLQPSTIDTDNEEGQEEAASCPIGIEAVTPDLESLAAKTEDERADGTEFDKFYY